MTNSEFEMGMLLYRMVLKAFKDHCNEHDCCERCVFTDEYGVCILAVTPNKYNLEKIEDAIRKYVKDVEIPF